MIYFIQAGDTGPIKIGVAKDPQKRLNQLQVGSSDKLRLIGVMSGSEREESEIHNQFATDHIRGEWFNPSAKLLEFIAKDVDTPETATEKGGIAWNRLVDLEPRLLPLLKEARSFKSDTSFMFCANDVWHKKDGLRDRLQHLVGFEAERGHQPELIKREAYDIAYDKIYNALPNCRNCWCW